MGHTTRIAMAAGLALAMAPVLGHAQRPEGRQPACDENAMELSDFLADEDALATRPVLLHGDIDCENEGHCTLTSGRHSTEFTIAGLSIETRRAVLRNGGSAACVMGHVAVRVDTKPPAG